MQHLRSDQYTHVSYDCPVSVDMHPDTFARIEEALRDGRNRLVTHLRAKATHDPAMSQLDRTATR